MSGSCKGEPLVCEGSIKTHGHLGSRRLAVIAVIVVDLAIVVAVDVSAHDRLAVSVIYLLVNVECIRSVAGHVLLDLVANCSGKVRAAINALVPVTVIGGELGNELVIVCAVETDLP